MAKTTEELREQEAQIINAKEARKKWLKEKDWFIVLDTELLYGEPGSVVFRVSELRENLDMFDELKYKGKCEFVYRTNKWSESLPELD